MEQVAILARVSTQGQDYERQVVELTDYCQRMNGDVVKVSAAKVSGATRNHRKTNSLEAPKNCIKLT